jgi:hypothetical protein
MTILELQILAREHRPKIKGFSHMRKNELLAILLEKEVISQEDSDKYNNIDYERLKYIRTQPRSVEIFDRETREKTVYPSIYCAGKAYVVSAKCISVCDGKIWRKRYEINCFEN